jgi:hypothetical protein
MPIWVFLGHQGLYVAVGLTWLSWIGSGEVVSRMREWRNAVSEMKEDPSKPAYRRGIQTAVSCCRQTAVVVNVTEMRVRQHVMCGLERRMQVNH